MAPHHPSISGCGLDKKYLRWWEFQLAVHCRVASLIDLAYTSIDLWQTASLHIRSPNPAALALKVSIHIILPHSPCTQSLYLYKTVLNISTMCLTTKHMPTNNTDYS